MATMKVVLHMVHEVEVEDDSLDSASLKAREWAKEARFIPPQASGVAWMDSYLDKIEVSEGELFGEIHAYKGE